MLCDLTLISIKWLNMWEEGPVPISVVLIISVTMCEIATDIHSWSASIL